MVVYGFAKDYYYSGDGTLMIRVRIPSIHGPYVQSQAGGQVIRNYVQDAELPYYPALLMVQLPTDGDVVALLDTGSSQNHFLVIGLTGGNYNLGASIV